MGHEASFVNAPTQTRIPLPARTHARTLRTVVLMTVVAAGEFMTPLFNVIEAVSFPGAGELWPTEQYMRLKSPRPAA